MRAIEISQFGPPEVLRLVETPTPVSSVGEVLIKVAASGVNRPDVLQRTGHYPVPAGASMLPGLEISGEIVGGDLMRPDNRWGLRVGDRVCALVQGGGYAEYCTAAVALCLPVPNGLSMIEAASLPETYFTVWSNVFDRSALGQGGTAPHETLLVQGGTSGIGVAAIQLAKALGHRVFATAGTDLKCRRCEALGAAHGINYRVEDFVDVIRRETEQGVDVVLDMVGGSYVSREMKCMAPEGRLAIIAFQGGANATIDLLELMRKRIVLTGSMLRPRSVAFKAAIAQQLHARVWPLLASGVIKPVVHEIFPAAHAAQAHTLMESGEHVGKLMLDWG